MEAVTVEGLLDELERQNTEIAETVRRRGETLRRLRDELLRKNDWVSVRCAADFMGVSYPMVYRMIDSGRLKCRHIGAKKFVRMSEVEKIDDGYQG